VKRWMWLANRAVVKQRWGHSKLRLGLKASGQTLFKDQDLLALDKASLRKCRPELQIVFQNPFSSLNPRLNVLKLVAEPLRIHTTMKQNELAARVEALLMEVELGAEHLKRHPHQLRGEQAQCVALARALALCHLLATHEE
jgi:peptide/nickel transport system ATP-binding protein